MQVQEMEKSAGRISDLLKSLASKNRLLILCELAQGERSVGHLAARLETTSPAMSQQLAVLRREKLVSTRRDGQTIYYRIKNVETMRLIEFLHDTFCQTPEGIREPKTSERATV